MIYIVSIIFLYFGIKIHLFFKKEKEEYIQMQYEKEVKENYREYIRKQLYERHRWSCMNGYKYSRKLDDNYHKQYMIEMKNKVRNYSLMFCKLRLQ